MNRIPGRLGWHGAFLVLTAVTSAVFLNYSIGLTADGSGTNTVNPTSTVAGYTGQTFTFTFTGAETMDSGEVRIRVPNSVGWSAPQGTNGVAGYTTVTPSGNATIANVLNAADSATGWTEDDADACNATPPTNGWGLDTGTFQEGTGSITCNNSGSNMPDAGDSFGYDFTAQNWSAYTEAGFWVRSDTATVDGGIQAAIDNNNTCASPIEEVNIPALSANTWTYVKWSFAGAGSTRTAVRTFCFNAGSASGMDSKQIWIDDLLIGPGSPTFVANGSDTDIAIRLLDLASTETLTTTYGSGGGTSGVTVPTVGGVHTFTTRTRISDAGSLLSIASSPTVTVNNPVPTTSAISPNSKTVGDAGFTMTVTGTGFNASSSVYFDGVARTTSFVSSSSITATIPASDMLYAGTRSVTVVNPTPGGGTSNAQTFTINNPVPTTSAISPDTKTVGDAGFTMTVTGTGFTASSTVQFDGSSRTTGFVSSSSITATIPASDLLYAGTRSVTVVNPTPGGGTSNAQTFTVANPVPTTSAISPDTKMVGDSGFTMTVTGTGFTASSTVNLAGSARTTSFVTSSTLNATIPASDMLALGTFAITVVNPTPGGGTSNAQTFTVANPVPTTSAISPDTKMVGDAGFTMTVTGTGFTASSTVRFDGSSRTTSFVSSSSITATIPASDLLYAGTRSITVVNPTPGGGTSNAQTFTINNPVPTTSSISPSSKTVGDAGFTMTVNGTGFTASSTVRFDGSSRTTSFVSSSSITATIPASDLLYAGTRSVTVVNPGPGGGTSNAQTFTINNPVPTTSSISPSSKTVGDAGFTMTVTGTGFTASSTVRFDGSSRTTSFVSSSSITATIPASDLLYAGTRSITVTNPTPGGGTSNAQTFTINNPVPTTSSISPDTKYVGDSGFTMTVNGTGFTASSTVNLDGSARDTSFVSSSTLTASILTADLTTGGTFAITVVNPTPGGGTSNSQTFTVNHPVPTASAISPDAKNVGDSGFTMTVTGTGFDASSTVYFAGSARTTSFVSSSSITATIPASDLLYAGTRPVTVVNPTPGGGTSNAQTFTVNNPVPTTSAISPDTKVVGSSGFTMAVSGTGFTASSTVQFAGSSRTTSFVSSSSITATIPASDLLYAGTRSVTVTNPTPGGGTSNSQTFTVEHPVPTTSLISPDTKAAGDSGFTMTVTGTGFNTSSTVRFEGSSRSTSFVSSSTVTASILTADLTDPGTFSITVFNPTPGGGTSNAQTLTVENPVPTTTSISPDTKIVGDSGFTMTVNGTNFVASSTVKIDGSPRDTTYVSPTQVTASILTADLATGGTFAITVTNPTPGGGTSNAQTFTVNNPVPTTTSISPDTKNAGDSGFTMTVNGTGFNSSSTVYFAGSARTTSFVSSSSITATILTADLTYAGTRPVTVVNPTPGGGTSNAQTLTIENPAPTTNSISPSTKVVGSSAFTMTVNGTGFTSSSTVKFDGASRTTTFVSSTVLTASILTSDMAGAGTFPITVTNPAPGGGTSNAQTFTVEHPVPTTAAISPDMKTVGASGFTMTVTGTGFDSSSTVYFAGSSRTTSFVSSSSITATIPASDLLYAGTRPVTVVNPTPGGGTSNAQTFTIENPVPTTSSISPDSKTVGDSGFTMTVTGTGFTASSTVDLAGSARDTSFVSSSTLTASILTADLATGGTFAIAVTNPTPGGGTSNAQTFTVLNPVPTTTSISPDTKNAGDPGFVLTVNGTGFTATSSVKIAGSARATTFVSSSTLNATILTSDLTYAGTRQITVTNPTPGGGTSNAQTLTIENPAPTTTSISPSTKVVGSSAFTMTVNGTGFTSSSSVKFDGASRTTTFVSSTVLTASILTSDMAGAGTFSITVTNPAPGGGTSNAQTFTVEHPVPTTSLISPDTKVAGDSGFTMTVTGTGFNTSSSVKFEGSSRSTSFVSSSTLTASILTADLTDPGTFSITVFNPTPGGGTSNAQTLTVENPVPTTTSISPDTKTAGDPGFTMTVNGTNFVASSTVKIDGSARDTTYVSPTQVTASILTSDLTVGGTFDITVTNPTPGGGTSNAQTFTVNNPAPTTTSISPDTKTVGDAGFSLTVNGTGFTATSTVKIGGSARATTFVSSSTLNAAILASDLLFAGTRQITVTNPTPGGGTSNAQALTVNHAAPTTTSIDPSSKAVGDSGFTLTVDGTGFDASSTVKFEGSSRATTYVSPTQVTAAILAGDLTVAGDFAITVTNPTPGGGTSNAQTLTVGNPVPTTTSISPDTKTVGDSTFAMTVNGTNFVASSTVKFGGSARTTTYVSGTELTVSIPASDLLYAGTFAITVTNPTPGGGTSNAQTFTVENPVPTTTSISPDTKTAGDSGFTMTVNGTNFVTSTVVYFAGSARTTAYVSATQVTASILAADLLYAGTRPITVVNPTTGGGTSNAQTFTVNHAAPTTASISPDTKTVGDSGFTLTVTGTGFDASSTVKFEGASRVTAFVSSSTLDATILASDLTATGTFSIVVTNPTPGGGTSNAKTLTVNDTTATKFVILNPADTTVGIPTTVTVQARKADDSVDTAYQNDVTLLADGSATGVGLLDIVNGVGSLGVNDQYAETVNLSLSDTQGTGLDATSTQDVLFAHPLPTVASVSPDAKVVGDAAFTMTVTGTGFNSSSTAAFAGSARTTTLVSSSTVTVAIPDTDLTAAGTFSITVTNPTPGGGTSNSKTFTVAATPNPVPVTTSISPDTKTAGDAGFTLTVSGSDFVASSTVNWDGSARTTSYVSSSTLTATILASDVASDGSFTVTVTNPTPGGGTSNGQAFTVNPAPPGATKFVIIDPADSVVGTPTTVTIQARRADNTTVTDYQQDVTLVASGSATGDGLVDIVNGVGTADIDDAVAETVNLTLIDSEATGLDVTSSQSVSFLSSANPVPTTTSISPTSKTGGDPSFILTVEGTDFVSNSVVRVNGSSRTTTYVSPTQVTALIPASDVSAEATLSITVRNPAPGGGTSNAQTLTVAPGTELPTRVFTSIVHLAGRAYPQAKLTLVGRQGTSVTPLQKETTADQSGSFDMQFSGLFAGLNSYGILVSDTQGRLSQTKFYNFDLNLGSLTELDIFVPPTIGFSRTAVRKGDLLTVVGSATPGSNVAVQVDGSAAGQVVQTGTDGSYRVQISTADLELGKHTARARQTDQSNRFSDFSPSKLFTVSSLFTPSTDLNADGRVDVSDLSILMARWGSTDPAARLQLDFNGDGVVDIADFSIFMRTVKGSR